MYVWIFTPKLKRTLYLRYIPEKTEWHYIVYRQKKFTAVTAASIEVEIDAYTRTSTSVVWRA